MAFLGFSVGSFCLWNSFSLATSLLQGPVPILAVQLDAPKLQLPQARLGVCLSFFLPGARGGRFVQWLPSWSARAKRKRRQARRVSPERFASVAFQAALVDLQFAYDRAVARAKKSAAQLLETAMSTNFLEDQ